MKGTVPGYEMLISGRWYVVQVSSGLEKRIASAIRNQVEKKGFSDKIHEVLVPAENVIELRRGEKISSERNFFPGYILIQMELNDEAWHLIQNIPKVTKFLGSCGYPCPIPHSEVDRLLKQVQEHEGHFRHKVVFEIGEQVRVCDGPFLSFNGLVEEIDEEKERLKLCVSIFGRETPVSLGFDQVEKIYS